MRGGYGHLWGTGEAPEVFWWGILRERYHLEDLDVDRRVILKWIFNEWNGRAWT